MWGSARILEPKIGARAAGRSAAVTSSIVASLSRHVDLLGGKRGKRQEETNN